MAQSRCGNAIACETEVLAQCRHAGIPGVRQPIAARKPMVERGVRVGMRERRHQDVQSTHAASASSAS
jgi:hypothetical protein